MHTPAWGCINGACMIGQRPMRPTPHHMACPPSLPRMWRCSQAPHLYGTVRFGGVACWLPVIPHACWYMKVRMHARMPACLHAGKCAHLVVCEAQACEVTQPRHRARQRTVPHIHTRQAAHAHGQRQCKQWCWGATAPTTTSAACTILRVCLSLSLCGREVLREQHLLHHCHSLSHGPMHDQLPVLGRRRRRVRVRVARARARARRVHAHART